MKKAVAHACIACNYPNTFDKLDANADSTLAMEARLSHNKHFIEYLQRRADEQGVDLDNAQDLSGPANFNPSVFDIVCFDKEPTARLPDPGLWAGLLD